MSNQVYIFDMDGVLREREGSNGGRSVANVGVLPVPMLPIPNWVWNWLTRKYGARRIGLVYYSAKEKNDGT